MSTRKICDAIALAVGIARSALLQLMVEEGQLTTMREPTLTATNMMCFYSANRTMKERGVVGVVAYHGQVPP